MSAVAARQGLIECISTVSSLHVLDAEPFISLQERPAAIISLIGGTYLPTGGVRAKVWRFAVRVCVALQDPVEAEAELVPYADLVGDAIRADMTLGDRASVLRGMELSSEGGDGYYTVNDVTYRSMVFRLDVMDKL